MSERDDFDKIVEGLDLDLSFPEEPADPVVPDAAELRWEPEDPEPVEAEEPFYRQVAPTPLLPRRRGVLLAWIGIAGVPLALVLTTLAHIVLDRSILFAAGIIFVAAVTYLFWQLPEHGPAQRDWPDDGAVL